jgi:60 kDa SS-A/Ro ribonucleoprotein
MMNYLQKMANYMRGGAEVNATIPQIEPLDEWQVRNSAGGYSYPVDQWKRLERFLILGSEGGSYYTTERALTKENVDTVKLCIKADGTRVVNTVVEISKVGRAPKNAPALFVLALCAAAEDVKTRQAALAALPKVARTGTHLFEFLGYVQEMRGWGRALRGAVADWYVAKPTEQLALQLVKYRQRQGWTHRDVLRLSHVKSAALNPALRFAVTGETPQEGWDLIQAFSRAQKEGNGTQELVRLILDHNLTWEMLPTDALTKPEIWEALLPKIPMTAMLRNLANMARVGLLVPMSAASVTVCERLRDAAKLKKARIHPIHILLALATYASGRGYRGKGTWTPVQQVVDALNEAFYLAFASVEPTGRRWYIGLDVSGSMACGAVAGTPLTPRDAAAAMSLVIARTEPRYVARAFQDKMTSLPISPAQRLDDVVRMTSGLPFGSTDCALPMLDALKAKIPVDVFCILTDSETWAGKMHPKEALNQYRERTGILAKLLVVGMVSNGFSIADPNDDGMLDVVGFDTAVPQIMADFAR